MGLSKSDKRLFLSASLFVGMVIGFIIGMIVTIGSAATAREKKCAEYGAEKVEAALALVGKIEEQLDMLAIENVKGLSDLDELRWDIKRFMGVEWSSRPPTEPGDYNVLPPSQWVEVFVNNDGELWFEEPCGIGPDGLCLKRVTEAHEGLRWGKKAIYGIPNKARGTGLQGNVR